MDIGSAIVARVVAVPTIGQVYDYKRYAKDVAGAKALFTNPGTTEDVRTWHVSRETTESSRDGAMPRWKDRHKFVIEGYMGVDDAQASERTFQDLVEAVRDQFRPAATMNIGPPVSGLIRAGMFQLMPGAYLDNGVHVRMVGHAEFATFFVHAVELELNILDHGIGAC